MSYHRHWVTRYDSLGYPYQSWERINMPRIPDSYLDCTIYLYESSHAALNGTQAGGKGFLIGIPSELSGTYTYAITNWHVIKDNDPVIPLKTEDGGKAIFGDIKTKDCVHD